MSLLWPQFTRTTMAYPRCTENRFDNMTILLNLWLEENKLSTRTFHRNVWITIATPGLMVICVEYHTSEKFTAISVFQSDEDDSVTSLALAHSDGVMDVVEEDDFET